VKRLFLLLILLMPVLCLGAEPGITAVTVGQNTAGATTYSLSFKIMIAMTLLTLLPALLMSATSFTRIMIVLAILRQAIGMPNIPTNQILIGISLFLTLFIMSPVIKIVNTTALQPYMNNTLSEAKALTEAVKPFKAFMIKQTRQDDLNMFATLAHTEIKGKDIPLTVLMPAFLTSELKTAFQMGFLIYLPFLIIDLVVASVLMSMGMMMLSPLVISLPFKIMLFVMINGWVLVVGSLSSSFRI